MCPVGVFYIPLNSGKNEFRNYFDNKIKENSLISSSFSRYPYGSKHKERKEPL